jgi:hypothetical protein
MSDPLTTAVAAIVITKTMDGLTEAGRAAVGALVRLVRRRLGATDASREILMRAESEPANDTNRKALAETLARSVADDQVFADELERRWLSLPVEWRAPTQGPTFNRIEGDIRGNVVQARDIHGGISFG